jgi:hypothetical protein
MVVVSTPPIEEVPPPTLVHDVKVPIVAAVEHVAIINVVSWGSLLVSPVIEG